MYIKNLAPVESVIINNDKETLVLFKGMEISITTDKTEFDLNYSGIIEWVTVDEIQLENSDRSIPFEYIEEIEII